MTRFIHAHELLLTRITRRVTFKNFHKAAIFLLIFLSWLVILSISLLGKIIYSFHEFENPRMTCIQCQREVREYKPVCELKFVKSILSDAFIHSHRTQIQSYKSKALNWKIICHCTFFIVDCKRTKHIRLTSERRYKGKGANRSVCFNSLNKLNQVTKGKPIAKKEGSGIECNEERRFNIMGKWFQKMKTCEKGSRKVLFEI